MSYHLINMAEKPISKGELSSVLQSVSPEDLLDKESKAYKSQGLEYMKFDIVKKVLEDPSLFRTPIVRDGKRATVGYKPDIWKQWLAQTAK